MEKAIETAIDYAGLLAIFGLGVLSLLYFLQARHIRDLEDRATFVPDDIDLPATPRVGPSAAAAGKERKAAASAAPADSAHPELEAARQVEVARAAQERRERFEERRGSGPFGGRGRGGGAGGPGAGLSPIAMAGIGLGALVLVVGILFGTGILGGGGDDGGTSTDPADSVQGTGPPAQVAVLNGTPVPQLAGKLSNELRNYKAKPISNVPTPYEESIVMFDQSDPESRTVAQEVAAQLQIVATGPMNPEVKKASEGATVAVIVGEDRAGT
jgi:hypothetical protein